MSPINEGIWHKNNSKIPFPHPPGRNTTYRKANAKTNVVTSRD